MSYFNPGFWLGMTASPERMDDFDIFKLFDHNIACEIRLQQALEEDLLCPFHYFGITEFIPYANGEADENDFRSFSRLVADERVDFILRQVEYYGHSGSRVKGLIFCSRKKPENYLRSSISGAIIRSHWMGMTTRRNDCNAWTGLSEMIRMTILTIFLPWTFSMKVSIFPRSTR